MKVNNLPFMPSSNKLSTWRQYRPYHRTFSVSMTTARTCLFE